MQKTHRLDSLGIAVRQFWYVSLTVFGLLALLLFAFESTLGFTVIYFVQVTILVLIPFALWLMIRPICRIAIHECALSASIINTASDGIILVNHKGIIQLFNPAAEALLGYSAAEIIGKHISSLTPTPNQKVHNDYLRNYLRVQSVQKDEPDSEVIAARKDGSFMRVDLSLARTSHGRNASYVGIFRDMSKRTAREMQARDNLANSKHIEGIHLAAATLQHEINNPLTAVLGIAQLIEMKIPAIEEHPTEEKLEDLKTAASHIVELSRRIGNVVQELTRVDQPVLTSHPFNNGYDVSMIDLQLISNQTDPEHCNE
jgi:PAS domain S-box-containing protein